MYEEHGYPSQTLEGLSETAFNITVSSVDSFMHADTSSNCEVSHPHYVNAIIKSYNT